MFLSCPQSSQICEHTCVSNVAVKSFEGQGYARYASCQDWILEAMNLNSSKQLDAIGTSTDCCIHLSSGHQRSSMEKNTCDVFFKKKMAAGHGIFYNSLLCCCGKKKLPKGGWITIDGLKILKGAEIGRCCQLLQCAQNEKAPRYFYILSHLWKESERPAHHLFNHPFSVTSHVSGF